MSQQHERDYYGYYGYPYYWGYGGLWGMGGYPGAMASGMYESSPDRPGEPAADRHLRSAKDVTGYHIEATDGSIGHVKDFVVDDETWEVRYLVVATTNWWPGKSVLVAPEWATRISWLDRKIYLGMTRDAIKCSPEWSATDVYKRQRLCRAPPHVRDLRGRGGAAANLESNNLERAHGRVPSRLQ